MGPKAKIKLKATAPSRRKTRGKKLKTSTVTVTVKCISKSIAKPDDGSWSTIWDFVKANKHLCIFPQRKRFCEMLDSDPLQVKVKNFIDALVKDYASLYKPMTEYSNFQRMWLDNIRCIAETASDTIPLDQASSSISSKIWTEIYKDVQKIIGEIQADTNFTILHSIARGVFDHQQRRVSQEKQGERESEIVLNSNAQTPDDGLMRMCGAEICRMIKQRKNDVKRLKKREGPSKTLQQELSLLKALCIQSEEKKGNLRNKIPTGIKNLDQTGFLWVPQLQLLPFLRKVDEVVHTNLNESNFLLWGENLFRAIQPQFDELKDQLFPLFLSSIHDINAPSDSYAHIRPIYNELWGKMLNLRKEEWKSSRKRVQIHKEGKTSSTTLMLQDELKPTIAKKNN